MGYLLVTNDFPPKVGGIQSYLYELFRRLPPEELTVLTSSHRDADAFDEKQPFRIERWSSPVLLPTPRLARAVGMLADSVGAKLVLLDPALPTGDGNDGHKEILYACRTWDMLQLVPAGV